MVASNGFSEVLQHIVAKRSDVKYKTETSCDGGVSWDAVTGPVSEQEAIQKKREIDHNVGWGIDTRVVLA